MIDKTQYYHGAAIIDLLDNKDCASIKKQGQPGYVVNDDVFVVIKYSTKGRSPWSFNFEQEDLNKCINSLDEYKKTAVGLVCGGDGICGLDWQEISLLLGSQPGRIAVDRKHNKSYSVWGRTGELKYKIPVNRWPLVATGRDV